MKRKLLNSITLLLLSCYGFAQSANIDYSQFIRETQKNISESGKVNIVWWIPIEFWEMTLERNNTLSKEDTKKFLESLRPYSMFAVIDAEIGSMGEFTYTPMETIKENIILLAKNKKKHRPLDYENLDPGLQTLLSVFKPMLKNAMGQLGENMNFFVFDDIESENKRISDPYLRGNVQ